MFSNPTSKKRWYHGKTPKLQINILRQIIISGEISKKKAADMLKANYSDVSDSMDALVKLQFIESGTGDRRLTTGHNYEKFYRITENGLKALLEIKLDKDEFWKVIILLCMCSSRPLDKNELEHYFSKYEYGFLGHHNIQGFFFLTRLFDNIIYNLLKVSDEYKVVPPFQRVLECLALNGPSKINDLVNKTHMTELEINKVINSNDLSSLKHIKSNMTKNFNSNSNRMFQILIVQNETKEGLIYELSLLGVMVIIAIVTYHFAGIDNLRFPKGISSDHKGPRLFYTTINLKQYFNTIALNYKNKFPLIFGKWDLLRSQLGEMLYDSFDFLLYKVNRIRTINKTVWSGGFKEYYDDLQTLSLNAIRNLYPIYLSGNEVVKEFERQQVWLANDSRMEPTYNKFREIEELLICTRIQDQFEYPMLRENILPNRDEIQRIENLLRNEISFLFYLSLNKMSVITRSYKYSSNETKSLEDKLFEIPDEIREIHELGSPKDRLMAILSKDKDIKNWFSTWIAYIVEYRRKTSENMLEFYDQINNPSRKRKSNHTPIKGITICLRPEGIKTSIWHQEYNIKKICVTKF